MKKYITPVVAFTLAACGNGMPLKKDAQGFYKADAVNQHCIPEPRPQNISFGGGSLDLQTALVYKCTGGVEIGDSQIRHTPR